MADVHQIIAVHGIEEARRLAATKRARQVVEAAYTVLSDDAERIGFTFAGFAMTALPHKVTSEREWTREGHRITLHLQSGVDHMRQPIGLPHGSYARLILLYLQTEAIRTGSKQIELGSSMHAWLGNMGISVGGATYRCVGDQAKRISACKLTFLGSGQGLDTRTNAAFVRTAITMTRESESQPSLWTEHVELDDYFFRALREHPVPISEAGIRAIGPRSLVIDIYIWLSYRLHALKGSADIGWPALQAQFGTNFARPRRFREYFLECLELALAAYPDAKVSQSDRGIVLHPSRPAVLKAFPVA